MRFRGESPFVRIKRLFSDFARDCLRAAASVLAVAEPLMAKVHAEFTYAPGDTEIATPLVEVFHKRRGVCQDYAHLMIACLRSAGLAARYVSGYLHTHGALLGADASHAWVAVFAPPFGWVEFDPTNNVRVTPGSCGARLGTRFRRRLAAARRDSRRRLAHAQGAGRGQAAGRLMLKLMQGFAAAQARALSMLSERAPGVAAALRGAHNELSTSAPAVLATSDFVLDALCRDPALWRGIARALGATPRWPAHCRLPQLPLPAAGTRHFMAALRRWRRAEFARIAWRDLAQWAALDETLADLSRAAERALCAGAGICAAVRCCAALRPAAHATRARRSD